MVTGQKPAVDLQAAGRILRWPSKTIVVLDLISLTMDDELFKPYPLAPGLVRQIASHGRQHIAALDELNGQGTDGSTGFGPVERRTRATLVASTRALDAFVSAIIEFNETSEHPRSVAKLNAAYRAQRTADFGVDRVDYRPGGPCQGQSYDDALRAARDRVRDTLYREYLTLQRKLTDAAKEAGLGR